MASQAPATSTKYVLVTGCTSTSLGSAIALAFAKLPSFNVFATARSLSSLSHFTPYPNITTLQLDVTSTASIAAAVELVSRHTNGTLDILVNNAGRGHLGPLLDTDLNEFRELLETNVLGPYSTTKSALHTLTHTLRHELSPLGVSVTHLTVGGTLTRLHSSGSKPLSLGLNSPYKPIESVIARAGSEGELHKVSVPAEKVAAEIVRNAVRRRGPKSEMWLGGLAWVMWLVAAVGLKGLLDWAAARGRGMVELGKVRAGEINGGKVAAD